MKHLRRFLARVSAWTAARRAEERLRAEIEDHLERQAAEYAEAGVSRSEARRQALLKFGGIEATKERWREERRLPAVDALVQETGHALRRLRLAPAFTIAAVLTLALGIGATTAIFTLVHAVLLKSLPVSKPDELYRLGLTSRCCYYGGYSQDREFSLVSYELYTHLRDHTPGFTDLAAFSAGEASFGVRRAGRTEPAESYPGEFVSGNYFRMFGIAGYAGRTLSPEDDRPGAPPAAVMSYRLWMQRFGGDPSVVGSVFSLNDQPFTIVGVTPPGFFGDTLRNGPPDLFLPLNTEPVVETDSDLAHYATHWLAVIGRAGPAAVPASLEARLRLELTRWLRSHWEQMSANERSLLAKQTLFLRPGGAGVTSMRERYQHWLAILMGVTGCVLLIVCANLANLMLVRGLERRRQTSLSIALGARPARVMAGPLIESLLLALAGGAAGLVIAFTGTRLILQAAFPTLPGMAAIPIAAGPSPPVLIFASIVSLLTGLAFSVAPAWIAARADPMEALRSGSRTTVRAGSRPRATLVVVQAALSLVLLSAAGLLIAVLGRLEHQSFGFEQADRIVVHVNPRLAGYRQDQLSPLYQRIRDALAQVPEVSNASLCTYSPFDNNSWSAGVVIDGRPAPGPHDDNSSSWNRVTTGYFDAIGTPIVRGRGISDQDTATSQRVAVVSEAFARKYFRDEDPIGRRFGQNGIDSERDYEIVGIASDARYFPSGLDKPADPMFFLPDTQHDFAHTSPSVDINPGSHVLKDIVIRTRPGARASLPALRNVVASVDSALPIVSVVPLEDQVAVTFTEQRLMARLVSFFGVLALALASIGLYGVTAHNAGQRTTEIGVRMALGASRGDVIRLVLRGAFGLILLGLVVGLPLTFIVGRVLGRQLYGASPFNPAVVLGAVAALGVSALVACLVPAIRASVISPMTALRAQ